MCPTLFKWIPQFTNQNSLDFKISGWSIKILNKWLKTFRDALDGMAAIYVGLQQAGGWGRSYGQWQETVANTNAKHCAELCGIRLI